MPPTLLLRSATPSDADRLTDLALRAKASWGYSEAFLTACRDELVVTPDMLGAEGASTVVAELDGAVAGFCTVVPLTATAAELDALFVDPDHARQGLGRRLLRRARRIAGRRGAQTLLVQSDPYAVPFYEACGGRRVGTRESGSIPGRFLPVLAIDAL